MPIGPGSQLGAYEVQDLIGQGAMGSVYRAYHPALARTAAVKVLQALAPDPDATARFRREAQAIARMRHPNILNVYDFGELEGTPYMVVEYVPGGSLNDLLKSGRRLGDEEALPLLEGIAAALDHAHGLDIVHRDVKPANVLLERSGNPVLADFGLAKLLQRSSVKTVSGVTTGTPAYMSPEQVMGAQVGPAADIYALATMAYELLAGAIPFEGEGVLELLYAHVHREPPPASSRRPGLGPAVDAVLARGLAKDPAARWPTGAELVSALRSALPPAGSRAPSPAIPEATVAMPGPAAAPRPAPIPSAPHPPSPPAARGRRPLLVAAVTGVVAIVLLAGVLVALAEARRGSPHLSDGSGLVRAGGSLRVSGSGFAAGPAFIELESSGRGTLLASDVGTNGGGAWAATVTVPSSVSPGSYRLRACNAPAPGSNCATAPVRVTR